MPVGSGPYVWSLTIRPAASNVRITQALNRSAPKMPSHSTATESQCLARGHWSRDLAYALSAPLTIEDRRAWERDPIALYVDMFAARSGVTIDFDEAWLRYRQQMFGALAFWTPTYAPPAFAPKNMQPAHTALEMIKRFGQAIEELDSLDSL